MEKQLSIQTCAFGSVSTISEGATILNVIGYQSFVFYKVKYSWI